MNQSFTDDEYCRSLIGLFEKVFPNISVIGGAEEPLYIAPSVNTNAKIYFRSNYPRSLLHEISHYCLAGERRRNLDDFGFWYSPCGRTREEQTRFELVEARPQGLEKVMCEIVGIPFSASFDDFSSGTSSDIFLCNIEEAYLEMGENPPPTAKKALLALRHFSEKRNF
ncbi:MAG: elongation factor P hydroxylase [Cognaticolwellia sp.]